MRVASRGLVAAVSVAAFAMLPAHVAGLAPPAASAALAYLAGLPQDTARPLAAYLVEAAVDNGLDPAAWPATHPALGLLDPMAPDAGYQTLLRPLHARAMAHALPGDPNLATRVAAGFHDGQYGDPALLNDDAWAILALAEAGQASPDLHAAAQRLASRQQDGGWSWSATGQPDTDTTGMVLVALDAAAAPEGETDTAAKEAAASFLLGRQEAGGGFRAGAAGTGNCDSTVWAIRGLVAIGRGVPASAWSFLAGLQQPDGGFALTAGGASNPLCSVEVASLLGFAAARGLLQESGTAHGDPPPCIVAAGLVVAWAATRRRRKA